MAWSSPGGCDLLTTHRLITMKDWDIVGYWGYVYVSDGWIAGIGDRELFDILPSLSESRGRQSSKPQVDATRFSLRDNRWAEDRGI